MNENPMLPADLLEIDDRLARLAEAERTSAAAGFPARVWGTVRAEIDRADAPVVHVVVRERAAARDARRGWRVFTPMRMAAALAILGAVAAVRLANVTPAGGGAANESMDVVRLAAEVESLSDGSDVFDDALADLGQRIDLIFADLVSVDSGLVVRRGGDVNRAGAVGLVIGLLAGAWVQIPAPAGADASQPPGQPGRPAPDGPRDDRELARARLERRLEEARRNEQRLTEALQRLEAGASLDEVRAAAEGPGRPLRGGRGDGAGRPRPPGPGVRGGPGPDPEAVERFLREHVPELAARLADLRQRNPEAAQVLLNRLSGRVRELMAERDPRLRDARLAEFRHAQRMFEVQRRFGELVRRGAPEAEVTAARNELRTAVAEQFELRMKRHEAEIAALEDRVGRVRKEVEDRTTRRAEIIEEALRRAEERARTGGPDAPGEPDERGPGRDPRPPGPPPGR
jgi:hypothetical protein